MDNTFFSMEMGYEKENIIIDDETYPFTVFLSVDDSYTLIGALKYEQNHCQQAVANYIWTRLDVPEAQRPSADCIMAQSDDFFLHVFELLFKQDETLKKIYETRADDSDICYRFISAIKAKLPDIPYKQLTAISIPQMQIPQMPAGAFNACRTLTEQWSTISEIATNVYTNTLNALSSFAQQSDIWFEKIQHSFNIINQIGNTISTFLQSVYIPELSEEQKEQLRCSHEAWGKYGWTQPPSAPITFLDRPPVDRKDATIKALKYCKNTDLERLFATLLELPHAKKSDINEAIFDFKNRKYKSSALILFALIDARLIRLQRDDDRREKGNYRAVGKGAAKKLFERIEKEQDIHKRTFILFSHQNILHCLLTVFADGKDFRVQPDEINRNFVGHGMLTRKVTRKDCVQLFLLYYNLLSYLDIIYGKH